MPPKIKLKKNSPRRPLYGGPHTRLLPQYDIFVDGLPAGYISRGHSILKPEYSRRGVYAGALQRLEKFERRAFGLNLFDQHKKDIIKGIGNHANLQVFEKFINSIQTPTHIEFWRKPATAAYFMRRGYELCEPSIEELVKFGLKNGANRQQIHDFLEELGKRNFRHGEAPLLVLTKAAEPAQGSESDS